MPNDLDLPDMGESALATALRTGADLAEPHKHPHEQGLDYALLPAGYQLQKLAPEPSPPRKSGSVRTHDVTSFVDYVLRHAAADTVTYGSITPAQFVAVLIDHLATSAPNATSAPRQVTVY